MSEKLRVKNKSTRKNLTKITGGGGAEFDSSRKNVAATQTLTSRRTEETQEKVADEREASLDKTQSLSEPTKKPTSKPPPPPNAPAKSCRHQKTSPPLSPSSPPKTNQQQKKEDSKRKPRSSRFGIFLDVSKREKYSRKHSRKKSKSKEEEVDEANRTIRDEKRFLKKIAKYRKKKIQRICVCPMGRFYKITDFFEGLKTTVHRMKRVCCVACCPPCCCIVHNAAFWPPPCDYFYFLPPENWEPMRVHDADDVIIQLKRKNEVKKIRNARKGELDVRYHVGMRHPCADDIQKVEGFFLRTSRNNKIPCVHVKCPDGPARFTILYSHPNGSDLSDHLIGTPNFVDLARFYHCDVYSYDYTGYGISKGFPSEQNMYADVRAVYEHILLTVQPDKIVLLGYSIGSAATVSLFEMGLDPKPAGVILQAPPASILRVMAHLTGRPGNIEAESCCMDRFRVCEKIHDVNVPVLVIHGEDDRTVPIEHGKLICQRAVTRVTPEWVPGGTHDNIENCKEIWMRIRRFVKSELKLGQPKEEKEEDKKKK
ncbi:unnamed protein product [Caenorhabditis angaria]|uniref:Serine aminopeptidase S33 domain-containing protein n=1 Tax=Caenorhabditis angaria TaxID=860376 RepID=A0A9P1IFB3_9PELO|nr:unnamed protein product [Caenorhabditis angaria]